MSNLYEQLSSEQLQQIDKLCDAFEAARRAGQRPSIEDYLPRVPQEARPLLCRELVGLELANPLGQPEPPAAYLRRFPEYQEVLAAHWAVPTTPRGPADPPASAAPPAAARAPLPPACVELQSQLTGLGILDAEQVEHDLQASLQTAPPQTTAQFTQSLVQAGLLTSYQAKIITAGKMRGLVLGNYVILEELGRGGMGAVFKARHRRMQRIVALKLISSAAVKSPEAVKRFHREVQAAAQLTHPHIVTAYDASEAEGRHFLVMEYVPGHDLAAHVHKQGVCTVPQAVNLVAQAARGLAYAHAKGIVHRDIKPGNLLLDEHGVVKVLDMGLARIDNVSRRRDDLTGTGQVMGTVDYMAPEQAVSARQADHRADIYSLGLTLWYLLTGRPAFAGESLTEKLLAHQQQPAPSLSAANPAVPPALEAVFQRMVAKDPSSRYQSMNDVLSALAECGATPAEFPQSIGGFVSSSNAAASLPGVAPGLHSPPAQGPAPSPPVALAPAVAAPPLVAPRETPTISYGEASEITSRMDLPSVTPVPDLPRGATRRSPASWPTRYRQAVAGRLAGLPIPPRWRRPALFTAALGGAALILAGILLFIQTDEGVIQIAINDEGISVQVDGQGATISGAQEQDIQIGPGEHGLRVQYGEVDFQTDKFILADGETIRLEVRLVSGRVQVVNGQTVVGEAAVEDAEESVAAGNEEGWVSLFNGQDLTGWQPLGLGEWGVENGILVGRSEADQKSLGYLFSESGDFADFHLRVEARLNAEGDSGLAFRAIREPGFPSGYEATLRNHATDPNHTGSLFKARRPGERSQSATPWQLSFLRRVNAPTTVAEEWFLLEVLAIGTTIEVRVNGAVVAQAVDAEFARGHLAFQLGGTTEIALRRIEVRDIRGWQGWPADAPPPAIAPFDAEQARAHQVAWADYLGVPVEWENSIGMKFVLIPPGEFEMGSTEEKVAAKLARASGDDRWQRLIRSEACRHLTIVTQPFFLGTCEVTQAQYLAIAGANPSHFKPGADRVAADVDTSHWPVESVTWEEATGFCTLLNGKEQRLLLPPEATTPQAALARVGYRLPTEAQWQLACAAGTTSEFWSGDEGSLKYSAWCGLNSGGSPQAVGGQAPSPWGLFDMHGNVWEWVHDAWDPAYFQQFAAAPAIDPAGATANAESWRLMRGGSWKDQPPICSTTNRNADAPSARLEIFGFRLAVSVEAVRQAVASAETSSPAANLEELPPADAPPPAIAPFDAQQARAHQVAWADYLGVPVEWENSIGMKFILLPPGEFEMGSTEEEIAAGLAVPGLGSEWLDSIRSERPVHRVQLTQPIYVGAHEVTQAQYAQVVGANPSHCTHQWLAEDAERQAGLAADFDLGAFPVEQTTWHDAAQFCARLSELEELQPFDVAAAPADAGYRLPTEAQWEFACRAGTAGAFWPGDDVAVLPSAGWFADSAGGRPHAVGELAANPFGLHDVHGNVGEWVLDAWSADSYQQRAAQTATDPLGPQLDGAPRVIRSASWFNHAPVCRSGSRYASDPSLVSVYVGFRVALPVAAVQQAVEAAEAAAAAAPEADPQQAYDWPAGTPPPADGQFARGARAHQEAWAAHLGVPVEWENSIGMQFVLIPPGAFKMGALPRSLQETLSAAGDNSGLRDRIHSEHPWHRTVLTRPFYLAVGETTQGQYEQVMGGNPSAFAASGEFASLVAGEPTSTLPVESVRWLDAVDFCVKLSASEELPPFYARSGEAADILGGDGYRLPTEAEWEFACRAGTVTRYWSGNTGADVQRVAWMKTNSQERTHPACALPANGFGLCDMHGNVWEWVQDLWTIDYYRSFAAQMAVDPTGPGHGGSVRVIRGGSWDGDALVLRSSHRAGFEQTEYGPRVGFRVALSVAAVQELQRRAAAPSPSAEGDREAAEWAQKSGATIVIKTGDQEQTLAPTQPLPPGDFVLLEIRQPTQADWQNEDLAVLGGLAHLRALHLFECRPINDAAWRQIGGLTSLEELLLQRTNFRDPTFRSIQSLDRLRTLVLVDCNVTDAGLAALAAFPRLESLWLGNTEVRGPGLDVLRALPGLKSLDLMNLALSPGWSNALSDVRSLEALFLGGGAIARADLARVLALPALKELRLTFSPVGDEDLPLLAAAQNLERLDVEYTAFSESGLMQLRALLPQATIRSAEPLPDRLAAALREGAWTSVDLSARGVPLSNATVAARGDEVAPGFAAAARGLPELPGTLDGDTLHLDDAWARLPEIEARDFVLRAEVFPRRPADDRRPTQAVLCLRENAAGVYYATLREDGHPEIGRLDFSQAARPVTAFVLFYGGCPPVTDFVPVTLAVVGDRIFFWAGDCFLTTRDVTYAEGGVALGWLDGNAAFRKVEYQVLDPEDAADR